jgi:iron complex transport system ATP-binding protein
MNENAISFEGLGFSYRTGPSVLQGYRGALERGRVLAILGPNGCGKTTLLKLLIGALKPREGSLRVEGRVAFVPQLFQISFPYSVLDMVLMGRAHRVGIFCSPSAADEKAALAALDKLGLAALAERPFEELSGGQRQLVIFARALATEADILILDEPTSALDLKNQGIILQWIRRLSRVEGLSVVITTHHPHHAHAVADTTMLMMGSEESLCGPTDEVVTEANLFRLYGVVLKRVQFEVGGASVETFVPLYPGL